MKMNRILILLAAVVLTAGGMWAKDDEVVVTRQLTAGQRNRLPEKTIEVETRRLAFGKKADRGLADAIEAVMDTIAHEDYQNRTFVLMLEPGAHGEVGIGVRNDDIVTRGRRDAEAYLGVLSHERYHFVVLRGKDNEWLLERTFKRQGKVKVVEEFEFVDYPTPRYPTNVVGRWSPSGGLEWLTVIINEDPSEGRSTPVRE